MSELDQKTSQRLDLIVTRLIEIQDKTGRRTFDDGDIRQSIPGIEREEALYLIGLLEQEYFNNTELLDVSRVKTSTSFRINHSAVEFIKSGGFINRFEFIKQQNRKQQEREKLEMEALLLGPKQHRFNKISVITNLVLTLITIILSILIATNIID